MARAELNSLRLSRSDKEWLIAVLLVSLFIHLAVLGGYEIGKKFGWWRDLHAPAWFRKLVHLNPPHPPQNQVETQPTIYVDVTDSDPVPPKNTIFYSDKNAHASNPDEDKDSHQPKLNGKNPDSLRTQDTPRLSRQQSAPSPQNSLQPSPERPAEQPANPTEPVNPGDLELKQEQARNTTANQQPQPPPRPRTLKQLAEQQRLPGPQMRLNGGARRDRVSNFDVKASPLGDYDRALIDAVQSRWDNLLDSQNFAGDRTGRVVIKFRLEYDGSVRNLEVIQNGVGDLLSYLCQAAIEESAPFGKWPDDMRREIGQNYRDITFSFDYY
jgi:hypothetical protein